MENVERSHESNLMRIIIIGALIHFSRLQNNDYTISINA